MMTEPQMIQFKRRRAMKKLGLTIVIAAFLIGLAAAGVNARMDDGPGMAGAKGKGGGMGMSGEMGMGPRGGMGMWDGTHARHIISMLGLDDNQTAEVKSILFKLQKDMIKKRADIGVAEVELEEILDKDPVDMKAAEAKVKQVASLKAEATIMHIQGIEAVKARLTPEQKKKLMEVMPMRGMGRGMMNSPMMKREMPMEHHPEPSQSPPEKSKTKK
jgi:Spy/CpxP family protein refolding chaperone